MRRSFAPWAALAGSLLLALAAAAFVQAVAQARDRARFESAARSTRERVESSMETYVVVLRGAAALLAAHPETTAEQFRAYVRGVDVQTRLRGVQGVGFALSLHRAESIGWQAKHPELKIWPESGREQLSPVVWIEPLDRRNQKAIGFDMSAEEVRRAALERARDSGHAALSGRVTLVQEIDPNPQAGFIIYMPVYLGGDVPATPGQRRAALTGWVYAPFRAGDLFSAILEPASDVDLRVYDGPDETPQNLLHAAPAREQPSPLSSSEDVEIAGHVWTLAFTAGPALLAGSLSALVPLALLVGLLVAAVVFLLSRRELEARARAELAADELRDADRRKDEFLAILGHELRNPLAPVLTALEVMARDPQSADKQRALLDRQVRHMVRLVDDLLDVSRISRGKIELQKQQLSVRELLERAGEAAFAQARARKQTLAVSPPEGPLRIEADPVRLEQVLQNLLTNAVKYTQEGGAIALSARRDGNLLEVAVQDNGIGIAPEALRTLFEPFVQAPRAKGFATGGLGIGLALVRGLVQLHGGTVRAESGGAGKGARFVVRLPGVSEGSTPAEVPRLQQGARSGRVLVVDDNADAAQTLAEAVRLDGHDVRVANTGEEALDTAHAFVPEVVLLDIGLPGIDGYEAARRLRAAPATQMSFIVALTGFGQDSDRVQALAAGFDDHLVKPVELAVVQALLRRRLGPH